MGKLYDVIIVGAGPAGLSAAIYAQRAKLDCLIIEKSSAGGQVLSTYEVDNYPGLQGISGFELGNQMREHAVKLGAHFESCEVLGIFDNGKIKTVKTDGESYESSTVLIAAGAVHAKLGIPGEEEFAGMGVSYCATCDGAFFKNKTVAVAGGGDVAAEDAIFLSRICKKVYLIHRRDSLRAAQVLQEQVFEQDNIEVIWDTVVTQIEGSETVEKLSLRQVKKDELSVLEVQGIFIAVGIHPNTDRYSRILNMDKNGYIVAGEDCITNIQGIFAAGDARTKQLRQIVTAVSDGANAVTSIEKYLLQL